MKYKFYGAKDIALTPKDKDFASLKNLLTLYDAFSHVWSRETCAPRMRENWSEDNKTKGQCSITSFIVQDIYGGEVYGIPLKDGNYHCFNNIDGAIFDLTSEQFGEQKLDYINAKKQSRAEHFKKKEKEERYQLLKKMLLNFINGK